MTRPIRMIQIGAGSMGGALLKSWVESGILDAANSAVMDPNPHPEIAELCEKAGLPINPEVKADYDLCVLGIKPQMFGAILPTLDWPNFGETLFVSIAAGFTVEEIGMLLKERAAEPKVLRVMPTLPAKVRRGVSLLAENPAISAEQRAMGERLMEAAGETQWCKDEDELDRLMGVTGCAPAFLLRAVEGLAAAAEDQGATPEAARKMAEETFIATAMLLNEDGRDAGSLREAVTSPGGTTAAGLDVLNERGLVESFVAAVQGAYKRAKELAKG
ncbi:pyrroline-5-carboxylate reductase [Parvularcula sp. ZS-1/3]|uniref:Pyrroline-5-carboxylate reductase n=1 Tax=Parvularcula mediterranea TaxID=2732508 RepID=A0A7Y3RLN8_9PROT|nr:pyrroline-5-carboxylate reductase [Parvularcula mediterranea]NNU16379.1 pyrroline-5-carboxylate reductase [Parvularcula mediterranea]